MFFESLWKKAPMGCEVAEERFREKKIEDQGGGGERRGGKFELLAMTETKLKENGVVCGKWYHYRCSGERKSWVRGGHLVERCLALCSDRL